MDNYGTALGKPPGILHLSLETKKFSTVVPHKIQSNSTKFSKPKFLANTGLEALFLFSTSPKTAEAETILFIYFEITYLRLFVIGVESEEAVLIGILF